ncbi:MAG: iron ABC transporter permease [Pseudomonadota bacterium]
MALEFNSAVAASGVGARYRLRSRTRYGLLGIAAIALLFFVLLDVAWGPGNLPFRTVVEAVLAPQIHGVKIEVIVWDLRLPVAIMAVAIGAMLGAAGAEMQTILNNPLADPFTLGISSAASFGAALAIVLQINLIPIAGPFLVTGNAFALALATSFVIYAFTFLRGVTSETMVLVGIALMFTFSALLSLMEYGATQVQLSQIVFWMMGSLSRASWNKIGVCLAVLAVTVPLFVARTWALTAMRMGDDKAASLGINVKRVRVEMLVAISLLASTAVAFVGVVAFVGLVGPHIARMVVGEDQRFFLPFSMLAGAIIMSVTSIVSKTITPGIIYPIGIITSLIGIPFFVSLILATRRASWR